MTDRDARPDEASSFTFYTYGKLSFREDVAIPFAQEVTQALLEDQWEEEDVPAGAVPKPEMFFGIAEVIMVILILKDPVIAWVADGALDRAWETIKRSGRRGAAQQGKVGGGPFKFETEIRVGATGASSVVRAEVADERSFDRVEELMEQAHRQALELIREKEIRDAVLESRIEAGELHLAPELKGRSRPG